MFRAIPAWILATFNGLLLGAGMGALVGYLAKRR